MNTVQLFLSFLHTWNSYELELLTPHTYRKLQETAQLARALYTAYSYEINTIIWHPKMYDFTGTDYAPVYFPAKN